MKSKNNNAESEYDFIIIGSGFGGSVSALRLAEKGYKVLVLEKGRRLDAEDFPATNWNLKKWLWIPILKFHGLFKITLFNHVTTLSGVGVGGGSLVYANTLPIPKEKFFISGTWADLDNWETELKPHYETALRMLGASKNPRLEIGDLALKELGKRLKKENLFEPTDAAVFFGDPGKEYEDPYFDGAGPKRNGCNFCGGCMTGCRFNAKNTLDKNYLYFAQKLGVKIQPESEVIDVIPLGNNNNGGYKVVWKSSTSFLSRKKSIYSKGIIFSGGVLGTVKLLLKLKKTSLPNLSDMVGKNILTNSESLIGVTTFDKSKTFSDEIAIGSILNTDEDTHLEPVRYGSGSGFWRLLMSPMVVGNNIISRVLNIVLDIIKHPLQNFKVFTVRNWASRTQILLFMQTINSKLQFVHNTFGLKSTLQEGERPTAFIPGAQALAKVYAKIVNGKPMVLLTETLFGAPTTAHILGGAVMGKDKNEGVIDKYNKVFGYKNMYVCDGSMISSNPGVNPSLSITAISERAMSKITAKKNF